MDIRDDFQKLQHSVPSQILQPSRFLIRVQLLHRISDGTYIKVKEKWCYLYRAADKENNTIDFLLTKKRDKKAAKQFFIKAIENNGILEKITIDKSGSNKAALEEYNADNKTNIKILQDKVSE